MAPEWLSEKISNFKNMNILDMALKHVIWGFRLRNYFREMFKVHDFMNTLTNFAKSVFKYLAKQFILTEFSDHVL